MLKIYRVLARLKGSTTTHQNLFNITVKCSFDKIANVLAEAYCNDLSNCISALASYRIDLNFTQLLFILFREICDIQLPLHISRKRLTSHESIYFVQSNFTRGRPRTFMNISTITIVCTGNAGYGKTTNFILECK